MSSRVDELHRSLDQLTLRSLNLIEELLEERKQLEQSMRQGFFQITQARSTMGVTSISSLQLPIEDGREARALLKVQHETLAPNKHAIFTVYQGGDHQSSFTTEDTKDVDSEGLRKRAGNRDTDVGALTGNIAKTKMTGKVFDSPDDPLKWFGVLVPQSLRTSQQTFHNSLLAVCRIATLQNDLESVRSQYIDLNKEMEEIKMQSGET